MKLSKKNYKASKIKNYIKTNHIFFLFNGNTLKSHDWISIEQVLKNMNFKYCRLFNKIAIKTLEKSIYQQIKTTINGITFFVRPTLNIKSLKKQVLLKNIEPLLFSFIAIKINNKTYSNKQLKSICLLDYKINKLLTYQYNITYLKFYYNLSK